MLQDGNTRNTKIFFENVIKKAPFAILSSQTDNGVEFTSKYISHLDQPRKNIFVFVMTGFPHSGFFKQRGDCGKPSNVLQWHQKNI